MKKLISLFSGVLATLVATPVIAQLPYNCGMWDATEFGYGLNPPIYCPVDSCWGNIGVYAEFVYFRPSEDDTFAYSAASFVSDPSGPSTPINDFATSNFIRHKFDPNFQPGYRVGVLYQLPCDQWAIDANYTYYYSKTSRHSPEGTFTDSFDADSITAVDPFVNNGVIYGLPYNVSLFTQEDTFGTLTTQVGSTWKLRYNQVDVDLTREYFVGPAVTFRPYFGFRGLFIQQHLDSVGVKNFASATLPFLSYESTIFQKLTCNSDGYGLHGGNEVTFRVCDGLSLFGNVGIHLLWTHFNTQFSRVQLANTVDGPAIEQVLAEPLNKESFDVMRFGADLQGGVQWSTLFNCNQNEFFVRFAWEHHIYMSTNCFRTYIDGEKDWQDNSLGSILSTTGDLALYGFSVGAGFTF